MGASVERSADTAPGGNGRNIGTALAEEVRPRVEVTRQYQRLADEDRGTGGESLADFLGYFSLGLGLAEVLAPTAMSRLIGVKHPDERSRTTMRLMGLREISNGVAILSNQQPEKAMWSRVAGDALDVALLGKTLANSDNDRGRTIFALANVLAVTALDIMAAKQISRQPETVANEKMDRGIVRTKRSITVNCPVEEAYELWHNFENLPRFMRHLESVTVMDDRRSHWVAKAPGGKRVEWDAETTEDRPNELIAWRSLADADLISAGSVKFTPLVRGGTEVTVTMQAAPPGGKAGAAAAWILGRGASTELNEDLRRLKQLFEAGELPTVSGESSGQRSAKFRAAKWVTA